MTETEKLRMVQLLQLVYAQETLTAKESAELQALIEKSGLLI